MARRKPLQTRKTSRYIRPTVIVLGETEKSYINRLKALDFFKHVHLKYEKGNAYNFETKIKEHAPNKNVVVFIDVDDVKSSSPTYHLIKRLIETKKYKGQVFFNNYAFELWLLNHLDIFSTPITDKTHYDRSMQEGFGVRSWSKSKNERNRQKIMAMITGCSIEKATQNIEKLNQKSPFENPSSNMSDWVKRMKR